MLKWYPGNIAPIKKMMKPAMSGPCSEILNEEASGLYSPDFANKKTAARYSVTMTIGDNMNRITATILRRLASIFKYSPSPPSTPDKTLFLTDLSSFLEDIAYHKSCF